MYPTVRTDDIAHLPDLQRIGCIFEWFLHLALHTPDQC